MRHDDPVTVGRDDGRDHGQARRTPIDRFGHRRRRGRYRCRPAVRTTLPVNAEVVARLDAATQEQWLCARRDGTTAEAARSRAVARLAEFTVDDGT
jgi:hypothetical protein